MVRREQLHGLPAEGLRPGQVEGDGSVAGQDQGAPGRFPELGQLGLGAAGRSGEGQRLGVVVGDHLARSATPASPSSQPATARCRLARPALGSWA